MSGELQLLYNGRNDLAATVVNSLFREVRCGRPVRYKPYTELGLVRFADLVLRFATELTPQVGPPFFISVLRPGETIEIRNNGLCPIDANRIEARLRE